MALTIGERMSLVRSKDTGPELLVRKLLSGYGVRYRLHRKDLPGKPDIYIPRLRLAIFINGCFWHGHAGCGRATLPKTNAEFWREKINGNIARDRAARARLKSLDIEPLDLWTCGRNTFRTACAGISRRWKRRGK